MSESMALLLLFLGGCLLTGPILALIALARIGRLNGLREQVDALRSRIDAIEARRSSASATRVEPQPAGRPEPQVPPVVAAPPRLEPPPAPSEPMPAPGELPSFDEQVPGKNLPPVAGPPSPPGPPPLTPPAQPIDWERWVGIRGAAVLGAVALGLAGLLFFKYSIEHGLLTPTMRVVLGTLTGLACLVGSEWLRGRAYRAAAEGISGAGVVILYAAFWAAHVLYGLVGMTVAFGLMILVTVACCLLSMRHSSLLVAVLGLLGGFATPLLLASGADRPIGLFGYVLLLDLGLLFVSHRRRWPSLAALSLLATVLMQGLWIVARMGSHRLSLGLVILGVFAALFVFAGRIAGRGGAPEEGRAWLMSRIAAIAFPFAFALYFAGRADLGAHLYPIAILLALLGAGAGWVARGERVPALGSGAAAASVAVVAVWMFQRQLTLPLAWELVAVSAGLAVLFHLFVEIDPVPHGADGPAMAGAVSAGGFFVLLLLGVPAATLPPWPWLAGWSVLGAVLYRHAGFPERAGLSVVAAVGIGAGLTLLHHVHHASSVFPGEGLFLAILVAAPLALQPAALIGRRPEVQVYAEHAAAALPVILLIGLAPSRFTSSLPPPLALGTATILGLLAALPATRLGSGAWYAAATGATWLVHLAWTFDRAGLRDNQSETLLALLFETGAVVLFTVWPFLAARRFASARWAWYAAALAGPAWFGVLRRVFEWRFGDAFIGALPIALGALALAAADRARRIWPREDAMRKRGLVWFSAVALCFVAVAIPLQLEKQWVTIGWALQGLAVVALWKRLDHPGLKYLGLALLAAATIRLVANPALLAYYPRPSMRFLNWLLYTYLVPAAALLCSAALLKPLEAARARAWEERLYAGGHAAGSIGAGLGGIVVIFVWINLAIADWCATGSTLTLSFGAEPAQRLTVSIAWAVYALTLLGFGMARASLGLRWLSLAFLLVTIGKVFLYDLGALRDLYRVASLAGLAVSLILVSLLYQRFVFRDSRAEGA
jgi:hypothetical protein